MSKSSKRPSRFLFVGNSFTARNDLPDLIAQLASARGMKIEHALLSIGGASLPTGGVFAEAVLGRSNAAEKLDITRFWNWRDSPIPFAPSEIAPVATGSRGMAETLTPGQLSVPVLNIMNPSALPAPTGLGAGLGALSTMNLRDMSGLAGVR